MTRFPFVLAACLLLAQPALAQEDDAPSPEDTPHVTALGIASATLTPDVARITLGVTTQKPTAAEAAKEGASASQRLVDATMAAGVAQADIAATTITLFPVNTSVRQADGSFRQQPQGFTATYLLAIDVRDLGKVASLTQTLIEQGANQFNGVDFRFDHPEAMLGKLQAEAMRDARTQAGVLADAAGVKIGRLLQVERPEPVAGRQTPFYAFGGASGLAQAGTRTLTAEIEATYAIVP